MTDAAGRWAALTRAEQGVVAFVVGLSALLVYGLVTGGLGPTYFLYLVGLVGMYVLLSFGLNAQWGYTGLINFSVAAFFGLGAYGTALLTAGNSPIAGGINPLAGLVVGLLLAAVLAVIIGIPTLRLRADYLAIASLGLAEVVRLVVLNERQWTNGSAGLRGIPGFFQGWPVLSTFPEAMPGLRVEIVSGRAILLGEPFWQALLNVSLVFVFVAVTFLLLRRVHRSPWGRVLRTIRSDEDLAEALGKNTYGFKMQSFVLGSVIMALAGVFYAHLNLFVSPGDFEPINTFYVWIAVILGGSGSNRGAMFGGFVVIAIREGTRFLGNLLPGSLSITLPEGVAAALPALVEGAIAGLFDLLTNTYTTVVSNFASTRLLVVGLLIILVMRFRPEGVLPPQRELIWPAALDDADVPDPGAGKRPHGAEEGDAAADGGGAGE
ncbi:branched-chain amino acid ABC transporter permease [Halorarius halobius]|uniref:branched-chain amino acid ABC transporter permease n=1 Tax=Halorarius halobius TaxID=2962671 RepID=UPI0020CD9F1B|nr:branched-chain amino acid ABC transporter permease [Halorarius halobius]